LGDVYRSVWTGQTIARGDKLALGMRLVWTLLLANAVGLLDPAPVELPPIPADATEFEHAVGAFYRLLAGLRVAAGHELATPLSVSLVQDYLRETNRGRANAPLQALRASGVLVGTRPTGSYFVYEPGELAHASRSASNERGTRPCGVHPSIQH